MTRSRILISCALAIGIAATFSGVVKFGFLNWDDDYGIVGNQMIRALDLTHIRAMLTDLNVLWRYVPAYWLSLALIHRLVGLDPWGYHLACLVFHVANALLLFALILKWRARPSEDRPTTLVIAAGLVAVWALHPSRIEVVAWATALSYAQAMFFALVCAHLLIRVERIPSWRHAGACLAWLLSLVTYPIAAVIVPLLPCRARKRRVLAWVPLALLSVAALGMNLLARANPGGVFARSGGVAEPSFAMASRAVSALVRYFWEPWIGMDRTPVDLAFAKFDAGSAQAWLGFAALIGAAGFAWAQRRKTPYLSGAFVFHILALLPVIGLGEARYLPADRYSYLVTGGWTVALALEVLTRIRERPRKWEIPLLSGLVVIVVALATVTARGVRAWSGSEALFNHILQRLDPSEPYRLDLLWRLGKVYLDRGDPSRAIEYANQVLAQAPSHGMAFAIRGFAKLMMGDAKGALPDLDLASQIPQTGAQRGLALALIRLGRLDQAREVLLAARTAGQDSAEAWRELAEAFKKQGREQDAGAALNSAR